MSETLSISFVLPMYNEEENIEKTIEILKSIGKSLTDDYEVVVVDDASTDKSAGIVQKMADKSGNIRLFILSKNTKFGGAFSRGFKEATKDIIIYMDSDMPVDEKDILESFPLIKDSDLVTGYSKIKKGDTFKRKIISGVYNLMVQILFQLNVKDINSGYKIVRRSFVRDADFISKSPFVDVELFIHAKRKKMRIIQYPLIFKSRSGGESHIARLAVILATFRDMLAVRLYSLFK